MKKTLALIVCAALAVSLLVPGVALAKSGGMSGRDSAPGQAKKHDTTSDDGTADVPTKGQGASKKQADPAAESEADSSKGKGRGKGKPDGAADGSGDGTGRKAKRGAEASGSVEPSGSVEASGTGEQHRRGIANAVTRIQANIDKAEAKVAAGTKKSIPPGLQRVLEKFLGWLGLLGAGDDAPDDGTSPDEDPGSDEPTETVEPTSTVEPTPESTGTVVPTETVAP